MNELFAWGGQSTGVSALASFLPKKSQGWSPSEWTGWISLQSKGLSRVFSTVQKHQFFGTQPSSQSNSHICTWPQEKPWPWLDEPLLAKKCLCFWICYLGCISLSKFRILVSSIQWDCLHSAWISPSHVFPESRSKQEASAIISQEEQSCTVCGPTVLIHSCYYNKYQTRWLKNSRNVLLIVLEARNPRSGYQNDWVGAFLQVTDFSFVLTWQKGKGVSLEPFFSLEPFIKVLTPFVKVPSSLPNHLPKALLPNTFLMIIIFGSLDSTYKFWEVHKHSRP